MKVNQSPCSRCHAEPCAVSARGRLYSWCRECRNTVQRLAHERRRIAKGKLYRPKLEVLPPEFFRRAGTVSDEVLGGMLGVCSRTIRLWRRAHGIAPRRRTREEYVAMGKKGNAVAKGRGRLFRPPAQNTRRAIVANASRAAIKARVEEAGFVVPTSKGSALREGKLSVDLLRTAMQAFGRPA